MFQKRAGLLESSHAKHVHFFFCKESPIATFYVFLGQTGKIYTVKFDNMISKAFENTANNAVPAGMYFNAHLFLVGIAGMINGVSLDIAVFKGDTLCYLSDITGCHIAVEINVIDFFLEEHGMCEFACQFSIIGKQQHTGGVAVKASYRIDAFSAGLGYEVHHRLPVLRVFAGSYIAFGLVQQDVYFLFCLYLLVVEEYHVAAKYFVSKFRNDFSVDCHNTGGNIFVGITSAADTGIGKEFVQAYRLIGVVGNFLIVYATLSRVLVLVVVRLAARKTTALRVSTLTVESPALSVALITFATLLIAAILETSALLIASLTTISPALSVALIAFSTLLVAALLITTAMLKPSALLVTAAKLATLTAALIAFATIETTFTVLRTVEVSLIAFTMLLVTSLLIPPALLIAST